MRHYRAESGTGGTKELLLKAGVICLVLGLCGPAYGAAGTAEQPNTTASGPKTETKPGAKPEGDSLPPDTEAKSDKDGQGEKVEKADKSEEAREAATKAQEEKGKAKQDAPTAASAERHSVDFLRVILEQEERETFAAVTRSTLDDYVKAVTFAIDAYLNKQSKFATKQLIVHCIIKKGGDQTFGLTSKPGLSGPITAGLDQTLRSVKGPDAKADLNMEIVYSVHDFQTTRAMEAKSLIRAGKATEAVTMLEPLVTDDCKNAYAWETLGWAYSAKGDFAKAEKTLKRAIELDPRDFDSWANLVSTYHSEGKIKESEEAAKRNLDCANSEETTDIVNINSALYTGEWEAAEVILRKLCKMAGDYGTAYKVILAYTLRWQGKNEEAKELLEVALKRHAIKQPRLDDYYEKLAEKQLALLNGDWKTAEELGQLDLNKDPKDYESLYDMGLALKGEGKLDEALKAFKEAVQPITPKSVLKAVDVQIKELSSTTSAGSNQPAQQ